MSVIGFPYGLGMTDLLCILDYECGFVGLFGRSGFAVLSCSFVSVSF